MATYQTNYGGVPAIGLPGQVANEEKCNKVSRTVKTEAGVAFGQPVERGANDHEVVLMASGDFLGFAALTAAVPPSAENPDAYPENYTGAFMTMGTMYVTVGETIEAGDPVYWDDTTGLYMKTPTDNVEMPNTVFDTSAASGGVAIIAVELR